MAPGALSNLHTKVTFENGITNLEIRSSSDITSLWDFSFQILFFVIGSEEGGISSIIFSLGSVPIKFFAGSVMIFEAKTFRSGLGDEASVAETAMHMVSVSRVMTGVVSTTFHL